MGERDMMTMMNKNNDQEEEDAMKYRGVRKRKWGKWVSEIRLPNSRERIWLGSYDSGEKAARAFDAALFCLRGHNANFNFPDQPPDIPGGTDLHPSQIQQVAAHYANSFNCTATSSSSSHSHPSLLSNDHYVQQQQQQQHNSNSMEDVISSSSNCTTFLMDDHHNNNNIINDNANIIPDFGIFPGFDDYFMPSPLQGYYTTDHQEAVIHNYDDASFYCSQDPCHLWNF